MDVPFITKLQDRDEATRLTEYQLLQNFPNPFNHETIIKFRLPKPSHIEISIHNLNGELITNLYSGEKEEGTHQITWNAQNYSSGVYFIQLKTGNFNQTIKTTLLK